MLAKVFVKEKTPARRLAAFVLLFLGGSFAGWCWEVLLQFAKTGVLASRGVLHGPWLPIYGIGCILMVLLKGVFEEKPLRFFAAAMVVCALVEYATSWTLEKVYRVRWWDYTGRFLNLNGRIYLTGLLFFAAVGMLVAYVVMPALERKMYRLAWPLKRSVCAALSLCFALDLALSLASPSICFGAVRV